MRDITGRRFAILLTPPLFLLLPSAVLAFILKRVSSSIFNSHTFRNIRDGGLEITLYGPNSTGPSNFTNTDVEINIPYWPAFAVLFTSTMAILVSGLGAFGMWELRRVRSTARHERTWSWVIVVVNFLMVGGSLGVLGWVSSVQSNERGWQSYEDVGKDDQEYTRETWSCQIHKFYRDQSWAGTTCGVEKATRFLLLSIAISTLLTLLSLGVLVHNRGGVKWLFGGKGLYSGFDNVYELQPTQPIQQPVL